MRLPLRFVNRALVLAAVVLTISASTPAWAQGGRGGAGGPGRGFFGGMGGGGFGEGMQPSLNSREMDRFVKLLALDKDQEEAAKLLFEGYQEQFRAKVEPLRAKMERAREESRESRDPAAWQGIREEMQKFQPVREEMEKTFMTDLKAVLRDDQADKWPKFERALRRDRALNRGLMSGERVNLLQIVERAELDEQTKANLAPVLEQYEVDLDREIAARTAFMQQSMSKAGEMFQAGDMAGIQQMMDKGREISVRVRDVNRRYARQVQDLVPEDKREVIATEVKHQSFPRVYQRTRAERLIDAAAGFSDLDQDQKAGIEALKTSFTRDISALNDEIAKTQEKTEMTVTADQLMGFFRNGGDDSPMGELFRKRGNLSRTAEDNLRKILSEEQQKKLPGNDDEDRGRRRRDNNNDNNAPRQRATPRGAA